MARKRMISLDIIDTDLFIEMPSSSQCLYFHLLARADDDGFIDSPRKIIKMVNCSDDDMKILFLKNLVIPFESGICVISHWKIHNTIQADRYKPTLYLKEMAELKENNKLYTKCIQSDNTDKTRLDKISIDKNSIDNNNIYEYLENNFGRTISPIEFEKINSWLLLFTEDMIKYGIELCVLQNKKTFSYLDGIFKNWKSKGYKLLSEVKDDRLVKKVNTPEWFNQTITRDEPEISEEKRKEIDDFVREFEEQETS